MKPVCGVKVPGLRPSPGLYVRHPHRPSSDTAEKVESEPQEQPGFRVVRILKTQML